MSTVREFFKKVITTKFLFAVLVFTIALSVAQSAHAATTFTFTGPSSGNVGSASTNFTITPDSNYSGAVTITPSGGGLSTPIVFSFGNNATPQTFTIIPNTAGTVTLTPTNNGSLTNPGALSYTAVGVVPAAPTGVTGAATVNAYPANGQMAVSFTPPTNTGGNPITGYTVTINPAGGTDTNAGSTSLTHIITGLTNGTSYVFTVKGTNVTGAGAGANSASTAPSASTATSYTFTGGGTGAVNSSSSTFTVTPNAAYSGTVTITPSGGGLSTPIVLTFSNSSAPQTFTITPTSTGTVTLTPTNNGSLADPAALSYASVTGYTYTFNGDTVGGNAADTAAKIGTFLVAQTPFLAGNSLHAVSGSGNAASINFNKFAATTDYSITWQAAYTATANRDGMLLRSQYNTSTATSSQGSSNLGYLFSVYQTGSAITPNTLRISRVDAVSSTTLNSASLTSVSPRWYRATVSGSTLTFLYSDDGVNFTSAVSTTDAAYASGGVQYIAGLGAAVGADYIDNVTQTIDPAVANISGVSISGVTKTSATIKWATKVLSSTQVNYGTTSSYGTSSTLDNTLVNNHTVVLTGLSPKTLYHYQLSSVDAGSTSYTSADLTFMTPSVLYDFNSDTIGQFPAGTSQGGTDGTLEVNTQALLGSALHGVASGTSSSSTNAYLNLDNFSSTGSNYSLVWKEGYNGTGGRHSFTLRSQGTNSSTSGYVGAKLGYNFNINYSNSGIPNTYRIFKITGSASTQLAGAALTNTSATVAPRWFKASVQGSTLSFYGSDDGINFTLLSGGQVTDSTYASGGVQYVTGLGVPSGITQVYVDDVAQYAAPTVSAINIATNTGTATITWTTDIASTSQVSYGTTTSYGTNTTLDSTLVTSHSVTITGLTDGTTYHFMPISTDTMGNSSVSSDGTFVTGAAPGSITITSPKAYQVMQRNGSNKANIAITGTYTGSPTAIEASWNGSAYTTIVASPTGGSFTGTLSNMNAGQGTLTLRFTNDNSITGTVAYVGVGDIYAIAGQSNNVGLGFNNQVYTNATFKASMFGNDDNWKELIDPTDSIVNQVDSVSAEISSAYYGGSVWPLLATYILADQSVPVAFIPGAKGGVSITAWQPSPSSATLYGSMSRRITAVGGKVKAVLYFQGETDADHNMDRTTYLGYLNTMVNSIQTDFGVKTVVGIIGNSADTAAQLDPIRQAQIDGFNNNTNIIPGPNTVDINKNDEGGDNLHFKSDADLAVFAQRYWAAMKPGLYGGTDDGRGPRIASITNDVAKTNLFLNFTDSTSLSSVTVSPLVFTVKDNGTPVTVSGVTRMSGTQLKLTLASAASGSLTVSLASGSTGQNGQMPTDTSTYAIPAEPFTDQASTTAVATTYTFTGPTTGLVNSASTNFTVTPNGSYNGTITITPSGGGLSTPTVLTFSNSASPQTFTITPTSAGTVTLTPTNNGSLTDPSGLSYVASNANTAPGAPTGLTATAGNAQATVTFTAPASNGGATITGYTVTSIPAGGTDSNAGTTALTHTITGLTNGTAYTFTATATNSVGTSSASSASNSVTPSAPATTYTFTGPSSGTVGVASSNFTVTPNASYNGTITVTPSGGGLSTPVVLTFSNSASPQTFTITPTSAGTVTLTPTNNGSLTNPSNISYVASNAATVPGAPTGVTATAGNGQATVTFTAPASNGGATITGYTVTSIPGGGTDSNAGSTSLTHTVTGLTNGTAYTFTVIATNSVGNSSASSASNSVTPVAPATTYTFTGPSSGTTNVSSNNFTVTLNGPYSGTVTITPSGGGLSAPTVLTFSGSASPQTFTITPTSAGAVTLTPTNNGSLTNPSNLTYTTSPAATAPGAPTGVTATAGNAQATVTFSAPGSNGGSAITGYTVTSIPAGGTDSNAGSTSLTHTITGLTNGTAYTFTVTATNSVGTSSASSASNSVTPVAPATTYTFTGPSSGTTNVASPNFTVTPNGPYSGTITITPSGGGLSTPVVLTFSNSASAQTFSITPTSSGSVTLTPTNSGSLTNPSNVSYSTTPAATVPGSPTGLTATAGNGQATVTFTAPGSNGGATITGYTVTSIPSGGTDSNAGSTSLTHTITGLTNGTSYTFTAVATNSVGNSSASTASNSITPAAPATTFTFTGPSSGTVGVASSNFTVTPNSVYSGTITITPSGGGLSTPTVLTFSGSASPQIFTITPTSAGTVTLTPTNNGSLTNPSNLSYVASNAATAPGAPTGLTATAGNAQATVTFTAPASNGGASITGYTVTSIPSGGTDSNAGSTSLSHTITGLTNGTAYTFTVTATNSVGTSSVSSASNSVTPGAPATVFTFTGPSTGTVNAASTNFTVTPNAAYTGTITVTPSGGGLSTPTVLTFSNSASPQTFTITPTATGTVTLTPTNNGSLTNPSSLSYVASASATIPGAPTGVTATAGNAQATVTFVAPVSNGGSAITGYTVTSIPSGGTDSNAGTTGLSHVITGLTNGTAYTFTVIATNSVGNSSASTASNSVTPTLPAVVLSTPAATTTATAATITWTSSITANTQATYGPTTSYGTSTAVADTSPRVTSHSMSLSGLLACTTYHYTVTSVTAASQTATSADAVFTTTGCTGNAPVATTTSSSVATSGGTVTTPAATAGDTATLTAPSSYNAQPLAFQVKGIDQSTFYAAVTAPTAVIVPTTPIVYNIKAIDTSGALVTTFTNPLSVTLHYTDAQIANLTESSLVIYRYDTGVWTALDSCVVDTTANTVTCTTTHFSDFALFGTQAAPVSSGGGGGGGGGGSSGGTTVTTTTTTTTPAANSSDCTATTAFSASTGKPCTSVVIPSDCLVTTAYSASTGKKCLNFVSVDFVVPKGSGTTTTLTGLLTLHLAYKDDSNEVKLLQHFLNTHGFPVAKNGTGSLGKEITRFGTATKAAVIKYQKSKGIKPADGIVGTITRGYINKDM